jgi:hypothetical protein
MPAPSLLKRIAGADDNGVAGADHDANRDAHRTLRSLLRLVAGHALRYIQRCLSERRMSPLRATKGTDVKVYGVQNRMGPGMPSAL